MTKMHLVVALALTAALPATTFAQDRSPNSTQNNGEPQVAPSGSASVSGSASGTSTSGTTASGASTSGTSTSGAMSSSSGSSETTGESQCGCQTNAPTVEVETAYGVTSAPDTSFSGLVIQGRGAYTVIENLFSITTQAILWTTEDLSRGGNSPWLETGVGARFDFHDAWVGAELGITHGSYLSDGSEGVPFDGLALRLYGDARLVSFSDIIGIDAHGLATYYNAIRAGSAETKNAFHTRMRVGAIFADAVALGPYFELFYGYYQDGSRDEFLATWFGGYLEATVHVDDDLAFNFGTAAGVDFTLSVGETDSEFVRVWMGLRI